MDVASICSAGAKVPYDVAKRKWWKKTTFQEKFLLLWSPKTSGCGIDLLATFGSA